MWVRVRLLVYVWVYSTPLSSSYLVPLHWRGANAIDEVFRVNIRHVDKSRPRPRWWGVNNGSLYSLSYSAALAMSSAGDEARLQNARETIDCMTPLHLLQHQDLTQCSITWFIPITSDWFVPLISWIHGHRADWTGLDKQTLSICVGMIEAGANPDTLAVCLIVRQLGKANI